MHSGAKKLFSLVELMVVIAILMVLLSLLKPALKNSYDHALTLSCLGNLKQIGSAHQMYIEDKNFLVPAELTNYSKWSGHGAWVGWAGIFKGLGYLHAPAVPANKWASSGWVQLPPSEEDSSLRCPTGISDEFRTARATSRQDPQAYRAQPQLILGEKWNNGRRLLVHSWYGNNGLSSAKSLPNWRVPPDNDHYNYDRQASPERILEPSKTVSNFDGGGSTNVRPVELATRHNNAENINILFWDGHAEMVHSSLIPPPVKSRLSSAAAERLNPDIKWTVDQ